MSRDGWGRFDGAALQRKFARQKREKLEAAAAAAVMQARKCCDHAQLTDYWKSFQGDLQLSQVPLPALRDLCSSLISAPLLCADYCAWGFGKGVRLSCRSCVCALT